MKTWLKVTIILVAIAAVAAIAVTVVYGARIQTMASIRTVSQNIDGYGIYAMDVEYDYDTDRIASNKFSDTEGFVASMLKEASPIVPVSVEVPKYGCSAFQLQTNDNGEWLTGRNYDFKRDTSMMLVHCKPKGGYESIAFAALDNIGVHNPTVSLKDRLACLTAPFVCMDGINSKGVTASSLTVKSESTVQQTGKPTISPTLLVRLVLDRAATTDEAVELLKQYDMVDVIGLDTHFFISDASGKSVAVEYDFQSPDRTMTVTPTNILTNFYLMYGEEVLQGEDRNEYGRGFDRYKTISDILAANQGNYTRETAWECLREASTEPKENVITSNTQWSIVYDNTTLSAEVVQRRRWDEKYTFTFVQNE